MGISVNNSLFNNSDANNDNIGMDSDAESVAPCIEQPMGIKNKELGMCFILLRMLLIFFHRNLHILLFFTSFLLMIDLSNISFEPKVAEPEDKASIHVCNLARTRI